MKNYNVKAIINFDDILENTARTIGDTFKCDKERFEFLFNKNAVELIGIDKEEAKTEKKTTTTRKKKEVKK